MANSLTATQEAVAAHLKAINGFKWHNIGIPDGETVIKDNNSVRPYYAYQFGDLQAAGSENMANPFNDDYILPIYIQAVAASGDIVDRMVADVTFGFIGQDFPPYAGSVRKRPGGMLWPIKSSNGATQAYASAMSFGLLIQLTTLD